MTDFTFLLYILAFIAIKCQKKFTVHACKTITPSLYCHSPKHAIACGKGGSINKHFVQSVSKLAEVNGCSQNVLCDVDNKDPTLNAIERFKYHPSIIAIKQKMANESFEVNLLTVQDVSTEICRLLDSKKSSTGVRSGLLKDDVDICAPILTDILNSCLKREIFPSELKLADITPILKSVDSTA